MAEPRILVAKRAPKPESALGELFSQFAAQAGPSRILVVLDDCAPGSSPPAINPLFFQGRHFQPAGFSPVLHAPWRHFQPADWDNALRRRCCMLAKMQRRDDDKKGPEA